MTLQIDSIIAPPPSADAKTPSYRAVAFGFLAIIFGVGLVASIRVPSFIRPSHEWKSGAFARAFEQQYDASFPGHRSSINLWSAARLLTFREGQPGVVMGRDGWLYTNEEFSVAADWRDVAESNLAFIDWAQQQLSNAGVPLFVVIVPEKTHVVPEFIGGSQPADAHRAFTQKLIDRLGARKIPVLDLAPILRAGRTTGETFLHTDTHWTPHGAELAAAAIALQLRKLGLAKPAADAQAFKVVREGDVNYRGDLFGFLPLDPLFPSLLPAPDRLAQVHTVATLSRPESDDALFGDESVPQVALVGSSYSAIANWNFTGFLEAALGESVANFAKEAIGPFPPMAAYLQSDDFKRARPRVVIWEIPERALPVRPQLAAFNLPANATRSVATRGDEAVSP